MRPNLFLSALFCFAAAFVTAEERAGDKLEFKPPSDTAVASAAFPDIQAEARRVDKLIRHSLLVPAKSDGAVLPAAEIKAFAQMVSVVARTRLADGSYDALPAQLQYFESALAHVDNVREAMPMLFVELRAETGPATYQYKFSDSPAPAGLIPLTGNTDLKVVFTYEGKPQEVTLGRIKMLQSLREAIRPYQRNAGAFIAHDANVKLVALAEEWDAYFEKARPQTFWDIAATTVIERKHFKADHLVGPPPRQWFVLHPNAVVENLDAAPDGDQIGGALAIEWIGVNWWNQKIPFGISLTSLYSDRAGVSDVGHGVSLYFANKYCIGWASHGGDNGFFASLDLLKFVDSKKSKLEGYRSRIDRLIKP